jgi:hypothetical protein
MGSTTASGCWMGSSRRYRVARGGSFESAQAASPVYRRRHMDVPVAVTMNLMPQTLPRHRNSSRICCTMLMRHAGVRMPKRGIALIVMAQRKLIGEMSRANHLSGALTHSW